MGTSTSYLRKEPINVMYYDNGCSLAPYIHSVLGIGSGTMSTSDQWLITLVPNTVNYLGTFLNKVFVKVIPNIRNHPDPWFNNMLQNLQKEVKIYAEVIKPIVDKRICPYFLPVLNVSNNCPASAIINMLRDKTPQVGYKRKVPDTYPTEPFNAENVFIRNMVISTMSFIDGKNEFPQALCFDEQAEIDNRNSFYPNQEDHVEGLGFLKSFTTGENIVSLHSPDNRTCVLRSETRSKFLFDTTYTMLYTVPIEGGETGKTFLRSLIDNNNIPGIYFYFFQLFIALATMSWAQVYHNDLHDSNILIQYLDKNEKFTYIVKTTLYTFSTNVIPILFDFDRSIVSQLDTVTDKNIFYSDMWAIVFAYYNNDGIPEEVRNMLISCVFKPEKNQEAKNYLKLVFNATLNDRYKFDVGRTSLKTDYMRKLTFDFHIIVENWANAANVSHMSAFDPRAARILEMKDRKQYITNSNFFDQDTGVITSSDPFHFLYVLIQESLEVDANEAKEIIARKQVLARQNLELLQLKLQLEKKPSGK